MLIIILNSLINILLGVLSSLSTIAWIEGKHEEAIFRIIVAILLCILICKVF